MTFFGKYATELGTAHAGMPACPQDQVIPGRLGSPSESNQTPRDRKPQLV